MARDNDHEESAEATTENVAHVGTPGGPAIPPMAITGLVVTKADLIATLRFYVPLLADISPLGEDRFILSTVVEATNQE